MLVAYKMNKIKNTKLIVQGVAVALGLLGILWIDMGLFFARQGIRESESFSIFFMTPMFIVLGGIVVAVAWQNLRCLSPNSIRNLTFLFVLFLYSYGSDAISKLLEESTSETPSELVTLASFLVPVIIAFILYSIISKKLIQIINTNNQHEDPNRPADAVD